MGVSRFTRDGKSSGWVSWPTNQHFGDPAMSVYAVVLETADVDDPFIHDCDNPLVELISACPDETTNRLIFGAIGDTECLEHLPGCEDGRSVRLLAAVCLGSCGYGVYDGAAGRNWVCTRGDLTLDGERLVAMLVRLYERPVHLVTCTDT